MYAALVQFFVTFLCFAALNFLFRFPDIFFFGFLNEDLALIHGAVVGIQQHGWSHWFIESYGPKVVRPLQLLSFAFDFGFWQLSAFWYHTENLALVSLGQTILWCVLSKNSSKTRVFLALLPISFARAGAESSLWLSSRHDLLLLVFAACCFVVIHLKLKKFLKFVLLVVFLALAFLCNEKAFALPLLLLVYAFVQCKSERVICLLASVLTLISYLGYRYWLLGEFVGGYHSDQTFMPLLSFEKIASALTSLVLFPFWSNSTETFYIVALLGLLSYIGLLYLSRPSFTNLSISVVSLIVSLLPTMPYSLSPAHIGFFSTRMYWAPLLVWSVLLALLVRGQKRGVLGPALLFVLVSSVAIGGRQAVTEMADASQLRSDLLADFLAVCSCSDPHEPQAKRLPSYHRTVTTYSDRSWMESDARAHGLPQCKQHKNRCQVRYRKERLEILKVSDERLSLLNLPPKELWKMRPDLIENLSVEYKSDSYNEQYVRIEGVLTQEFGLIVVLFDQAPVSFINGRNGLFRLRSVLDRTSRSKQSIQILGLSRDGNSVYQLHP